MTPPEGEKKVVLKELRSKLKDIEGKIDQNWVVAIKMPNRENAVSHIAGLANLMVSLEMIGKSAVQDPRLVNNAPVQDIYFKTINDAQQLATIHITQLMMDHKITWEEVLEEMVKNYMQAIPENQRVGQFSEENIRKQAEGIVQTAYEIKMRCHAISLEAVSKGE